MSLCQQSARLVVVGLSMLSPAALAAAPLAVLSHEAVVQAGGEVLFKVEFNRPPDFYTVDSVGRQADEFQFYVFHDNNSSRGRLTATL